MTYGNSSGHYKRNPEYYRERNNARRHAVQEFVRRYKAENPCADCGLTFPHYVMDFDHLRDKTAMISKLTRQTTLPRVMEEISKCELVCANCHRERTYRRSLMDKAEGFEPL